MFDSVRNNKKIVQLFLILITVPFALWGVESYLKQGSGGGEVATVGKMKISQQEFNNALNQQKDRLRAQSPDMDTAIVDSSAVRGQLLDGLIAKKLLLQAISKNRLAVNNAELVEAIASIPDFQENNQFSSDRYEKVLSAQGLSKEVFEARMRQDIATQQLILPVAAARIPGITTSAQWLSVQLAQRELVETQLPYANYRSQVVLAPGAAEKYYADHGKLFELPAQVRVEYVVLSADALAAQQSAVSEEEIKARYNADLSRYTESESRQASHILIAVAPNAAAADVKSAQAKAQGILDQLKQNKVSFAELAKQNSQDSQSAQKGGDLGWFNRGVMTKAFEDAVFAAKEGELPFIVRTGFGFHVVRLTGIKAAKVKPLDEVKTAIAAEIKHELGAKQYAEAVEAFGNMVYEQPDSLSPVVTKWKLVPQQTGWLKQGDKQAFPFENKKLLNALFDPETIKKHRNADAVEVAPGVMVAARVLEHKPATRQAFALVKATIESQLIQEAAVKLAIQDGEGKVSRLTRGEDVGLSWSSPKMVSQLKNEAVPSNALGAIFKAKTDKLPAFVGVAGAEAYGIYRINAVKEGNTTTDSLENRQLLASYERAVTEEEAAAWLATLREEFPVKVKSSMSDSR
jgi:peptidyl-prolyl cis-trans isomerase D